MKKYVSTIVAGLAGLAIASSASAATNIIHITGSTAFRGATMTAIGHILKPGYLVGFVGSGPLTKASFAEFRGTTSSGSLDVDIKVSWSGAVGGIQVLDGNLNVSTWLNAPVLPAGPAGGSVAANYDAPAPAEIAMGDSGQGSTAFNQTVLHDTSVGVIPFRWVRNAATPSTANNMTTLLAQELLAAGQIPLSQFTGNPADVTTTVTVTGRDEDSGTRLVTYAETGFGIFNPPFQYQPVGVGSAYSNGTITALNPWPINTVNGLTYPVGHSGYSSGGTVAIALGTAVDPALTAQGLGSLMSYLGVNDAATAVGFGVGAGYMLWNGFDYSPTAVEEGQYTFWNYEHLLYRSNYAAPGKTVADQIAAQIINTDATASGILLGSMHVSRQVEGAVVTPQ